MKVLLIHPPPYGNATWVRQGRCIVWSTPKIRMEFPVFMAYAASILKESGHSVAVIDANAEELTLTRLQQKIKSFSPDAIIVESIPHTFEGDKKIAELTKEIDKDICTIYYGWQPTARPIDVLMNNSIDFVVRGEPEKTLEQLANFLKQGKKISDIQGLSFKENGIIKHNDPRPFLNNIDELPIPARELFPVEKYFAIPLGRITTVVAARGCPYPCIYCSTHLIDGSTLRARKPMLVAEEIEEIVHKFKIRTIFFYADNFTLWGDKKIIEFCKELSSRKLQIRWLANSRIDTLPSDNALRYMAKTGCFTIQFGVESGCLKMVQTMKKARTESECERYVENIKPNIERTKKAGIFTKVNMLVGFEGENQDTVQESVKRIKESDPDIPIHFNHPIPNPGSVIGKEAEKRGIIPPDGEGLQYNDHKLAMAIGSAWNKCESDRLIELQKYANNATKLSTIRKLELGLKLFRHFAIKGDWDILLNVGKMAIRENVNIMNLVDIY
jgi:anaerobic magnesium-protoporphyrin IX monomethyl ester cyclase